MLHSDPRDNVDVKAAERVAAARWLSLALGSLVAAGALSLLLVLGRAPLLNELFLSPLFFRRCLVVHVDLALIVWLVSFLMCLFFLIPSSRRPSRPSRMGSGVALFGIVLFAAATAVPDAEPVLANYVPVVDHPLFLLGLAVFGSGVVLSLFDARMLPGREAALGEFAVPPAARVGIRAGVLTLIAAVLTFLASAISTPRDLPTRTYYELVAWGGGHTLQSASIAAMLANWFILLSLALNRPVLSRRTAIFLFVPLTAPFAAGPLMALHGTTVPPYYDAFTQVMRWTIFPVVTLAFALCVRELRRESRANSDFSFRDARVLAFFASAGLSAVGFVLGAMIRGADTRIPAHYHAAIGAVTVSCMAVTYPLLAHFGAPVERSKFKKFLPWQPVTFGVGQLVFAIGFGLAGAHGTLRKTYGVEQQPQSVAEVVGLVVMALGGIVAVAAGVLFVVVVAAAWFRRRRPLSVLKGGNAWKAQNILSRS